MFDINYSKITFLFFIDHRVPAAFLAARYILAFRFMLQYAWRSDRWSAVLDRVESKEE